MENEQSLRQKKIALAQSEQASVIVELVRDCMPRTPILAETEFKTLVNAITLEANSALLLALVEHIEGIRKGSLHEQQ